MKSRIFRSSHALLLISSCSLLIACNSQPVQDAQIGMCPQDRHTEMAPAKAASMSNPLNKNDKNIEAGEKLYQSTAKPLACVECHGENGDGNGPMANMFEPAPRNFTCSDVVATIPDGQLYWVIKNGSIGTSMPAFDKLSDNEIWQLTLYIRSLERKPAIDKSLKAANVKPEQAASL